MGGEKERGRRRERGFRGSAFAAACPLPPAAFPSPACGGGWVGGRFRASGSGGGASWRGPSRRETLTRPLPPSGRGVFVGERPPASAARCRPPPSLPLPRLRGRTGGGPLSRQRKRRRSPAERSRHAEGPSPNLSRPAGGVFMGAALSSPPPRAGEDGWGAAFASAEAAGGARRSPAERSVTPRDPHPTSPAQRERGFC